METGGAHIPIPCSGAVSERENTARNSHPPRGTTKAASELQMVYRREGQTSRRFQEDVRTTRRAREASTWRVWESAPAPGGPEAWHRRGPTVERYTQRRAGGSGESPPTRHSAAPPFDARTVSRRRRSHPSQTIRAGDVRRGGKHHRGSLAPAHRTRNWWKLRFAFAGQRPGESGGCQQMFPRPSRSWERLLASAANVRGLQKTTP